MKNKDLGEIQRLIRQINDWAQAYYSEDAPLVPDATYDEALRQLSALESAHPELRQADSPTLRVGQPPRKGFVKHPHLQAMLSLTNSHSIEDLRDFYGRAGRLLDLKKITLESWDGALPPELHSVVEEKMDGLAVAITYESGVLSQAATRGDGLVGELVTDNIRTIKPRRVSGTDQDPGVPLRLSLNPKNSSLIPESVRASAQRLLELPRFEVRGEVYMRLPDFDELNSKLTQLNEKPFANPRNAAAGSLRLLDSTLTERRPLRFFAYQIVGLELDQSETLLTLSALGFPVNPNRWFVTHLADLEKLILFYSEVRRGGRSHPFGTPPLPRLGPSIGVSPSNQVLYETDGLVIKINRRDIVQQLGAIANSPRSATAFKLAPLEALTTVERIEVQVGRTGALTPVAWLKPVSVGGVVVSRATLHNEDQLQAKDVRVGDTVWIRRAGDVIPEILRVKTEDRLESSEPYRMPRHCPVCQTLTVREKSVRLCPNTQCPAKNLERFRHFASRHAMDIRGLGDQIITKLVELGYLRSLSDLYRLRDKQSELIALEGLGEKSIEKILDSVETSKSQSAARFLFALGIPLIGEKTAEDLLQATGSLKKLFSLTEEQLLVLNAVGPETARALLEASQDEALQHEIQTLRELGVQGALTEEAPQSKSSFEGPLSGKTFVITGTLSRPRDEIRDWLRSHGAQVSDSLSKNTSYLLAGEKSGSKLKKANSLGVAVISEQEMQNLLNEGLPHQ